MILDEIKKANMQALKDKNQTARTIYSVVITKAMLEIVKKREKGEELTDADMSQILQKTLKELAEEAESYRNVNKLAEAEEIEKQKEIISAYLPKMLSEEEIYSLIEAQEDKSIQNIMRFFKMNYAGKVEMSKVNLNLKKFN